MQNFILACLQLDPLAMLQAGSYVGLAFLIFAESGLLFGIFLPGDSLLFAAGLLAANGFFAFLPLLLVTTTAAILGDSVGYWFGKKAGETLFKKEDSRFFKQAHLERTKLFYEKYGGRAVILARFVPIVRTLAPILAGTGSMPYRTFLSYNIIGGLLWGVGMTTLGFSLGSIFPSSEKYILPLSLLIIVISFLPVLFNIIKNKSVL